MDFFYPAKHTQKKRTVFHDLYIWSPIAASRNKFICTFIFAKVYVDFYKTLDIYIRFIQR